MIRVLLSLGLTVTTCLGAPQSKAAAPASPRPTEPAAAEAAPNPSPTPNPNSAASRMQASIDKQRAAVRKQVGDWISVGEAQPNDGFLIPFPKPAVPATSIALRAMLDSIPCDPVPESDLDKMVNDAAARQKVSPKLVRAIINQESAGRPCAVSTAGAQGLMQLMPEVQREYAVADPFDPKESVEAGVKLLRTLIDRYAGDLPKALAAYNAGPGAVDRAGGIPPIPETTNYVSKIIQKIE